MVVYWPLTGRREELSIIERTLGEDQQDGPRASCPPAWATGSTQAGPGTRVLR